MDGQNQPESSPITSSTYRCQSLKTAVAYLSRKNLRHNATLLKNCCSPSVKFCAMVKADAYGHDARTVVTILNDGPADSFAVASLEEAADIFPFVAGKDIIITPPLYAGIPPELIKLAQARFFHGTICSLNALDYVKQFLDPEASPLNLHLKIDTGMGRLGCDETEARRLIGALKQSPLLNLAGVFTHFATADEPDLTFAYQQLHNFQDFLTRSGLDRNPSVIKHAANTAATLRIRAAHYDMVRCGIGLYGYTNFQPSPVPPTSCRQIPNPRAPSINSQSLVPNPQPSTCNYDLRPVLKVQAPVVQVKTLKKGCSCGYGRTFIAQRDCIIGIVTFGYADGLFCRLSNLACMRYGDYNLPIIGRVSMDMTALDLTHLPNPAEGMMVTVIDDDPDSPCSAFNLAQLADTHPYEILTALGNRIKRALVD